MSVSHVIKCTVESWVNIQVHAIQDLIITVLQQISHLNCTDMTELKRKAGRKDILKSEHFNINLDR